MHRTLLRIRQSIFQSEPSTFSKTLSNNSVRLPLCDELFVKLSSLTVNGLREWKYLVLHHHSIIVANTIKSVSWTKLEFSICITCTKKGGKNNQTVWQMLLPNRVLNISVFYCYYDLCDNFVAIVLQSYNCFDINHYLSILMSLLFSRFFFKLWVLVHCKSVSLCKYESISLPVDLWHSSFQQEI